MTMPVERTYSLMNTREFLLSLIDTSKTKRVPKEIRRKAYYCLRHYPHQYELEEISKKCPDILGKVKTDGTY
jgi:hypothetical protein